MIVLSIKLKLNVAEAGAIVHSYTSDNAVRLVAAGPIVHYYTSDNATRLAEAGAIVHSYTEVF